MRLNCITRVLGPHSMSMVGKISFVHSILGTHTLHGVFVVLALSIVSCRRASALSHVQVCQTVPMACASNEARAQARHVTLQIVLMGVGMEEGSFGLTSENRVSIYR